MQKKGEKQGGGAHLPNGTLSNFIVPAMFARPYDSVCGFPFSSHSPHMAWHVPMSSIEWVS